MDLLYFIKVFFVVRPICGSKFKVICSGQMSRSHFLQKLQHWPKVMELSYFTCVFDEVRPFLWCQAKGCQSKSRSNISHIFQKSVTLALNVEWLVIEFSDFTGVFRVVRPFIY